MRIKLYTKRFNVLVSDVLDRNLLVCIFNRKIYRKSTELGTSYMNNNVAAWGLYGQGFFSLLPPLSRFLTFKMSKVREVHQTCGRFVREDCAVLCCAIISVTLL